MASPANEKHLHTDQKGVARCWWGCGDPDYEKYHDEEWGRPDSDDFRLFEKLCLESFQSGLSWLTILRKRENFRAAFAEFDFTRVAEFRDKDLKRLLADEGIVRHRGKIEATINNAQRAIELVDEFGSLAAYIWQWEPTLREVDTRESEDHSPIPSVTETSKALSRDLKTRGWKFFGPTTAYAFMQAMGLVNDHLIGCTIHDKVEALRGKFKRPK